MITHKFHSVAPIRSAIAEMRKIIPQFSVADAQKFIATSVQDSDARIVDGDPNGTCIVAINQLAKFTGAGVFFKVQKHKNDSYLVVQVAKTAKELTLEPKQESELELVALIIVPPAEDQVHEYVTETLKRHGRTDIVQLTAAVLQERKGILLASEIYLIEKVGRLEAELMAAKQELRETQEARILNDKALALYTL